MTLKATLHGAAVVPYLTGRAVTGEAEFSDGERLRFRYRPARPGHTERCDLFTLRHGTDVTSPRRADMVMTLARPIMPVQDQTRHALQTAERFIAGFEGDEMQEGIDDLLAMIRAALALQ